MTTIDDIKADFALLDDWEDRYRYLIELGKTLEPLPELDRTDANRVRGCASQVWLSTRPQPTEGQSTTLHFIGDSDALIVRGLVAIAIGLFNDKSPRQILATDAGLVFEELGLREHLTAQRSNGFRSLVERIKKDAEAALARSATG